MTNKHIGSSLDDFLENDGVKEAFEADAITRVENWIAETNRCRDLYWKERIRVQELEAGLRMILNFSDFEMQDGDGAREVARKLLETPPSGAG